VGAQGHRQRLNIKIINIDKLDKYLNAKVLIATDTVIDPTNLRNTVKTAWEETDAQLWLGEPPKLTIEYDPGTGFLLQLNLQWNEQRQHGDKNQLVILFLENMVHHGIIEALNSDALNKLNLLSLEVYMYENRKKKEEEKQERDDGGEENDEHTGSKYAFSEKKKD
jgi:hypothetical protein